MTEAKFWEIIQVACRSDIHLARRFYSLLAAELRKLTPDEIVAWDRHFIHFLEESHQMDLWGASSKSISQALH